MKLIYASEIQKQYLNKIREHAPAYIGGTSKLFEYIRRSGEMANTLPLKGNEETPLAGSSPASGKLLWCNAHQRRAERCKNSSGILLPCEIVDLTNEVEIDESQSNEKDR